MIIKNSNLRRNLFSNRYKILAIIIAIILVLSIIRILNETVKQSNQQKNYNIIQNTTQTQPIYTPQETIIQGGDVPIKQQEKNTDVMDNFIQYCNTKQIEEAYNLLTDECKELLFNSNIEKFKTEYVNKIFNTPKTYSMQSWMQSNAYTYKVRIVEDILATGKVGDVIENYYTIVNKNGKYKINLNGYIDRVILNKQYKANGITITVISQDIYKDYEKYNIKVENNTEKTILLDSKQNAKSVYVTGSNNTKYSAYMYELDDYFLTIQPHIYRNLNLKINKIYNTNISSKKLTFTDIIQDVESYNKTTNKKEYKDTIQMEIDL